MAYINTCIDTSKIMKKKSTIHIQLFTICLVLIACTNQVSDTNDFLVLGVIRTVLNLPDTYTIDANGAGAIEIQLPATLNSDPEWSPDRKWIISSTQYQVKSPKDSEIYLMRSDGSQRILVAHHAGGSFHPTWSPDSKQIAYSARDNQNGVYILDVSCFQQGNKNCKPLPIFLASGDYSTPDWSPDRKEITYEKDGNIHVIDANGKGQPTGITTDMKYCRDPKWSPDGKKIAFSCYLPDHFDIFVASKDGSALINLTNGIGSSTRPQWSDDGSTIAFISTRDGLGQIIGMEDTIRSSSVFLMNNDGSNVVRLSLRDDEDVLWFTWLNK